MAADRILTDTDLKKIKVLKLRKAMQRVDKTGFAEDKKEDDEDGAEEGEIELSEGAF